MIKIHITNATLEIVDDQQNQQDLITELEAALKKANIYIDTMEKLFVKNEDPEAHEKLNFPGIHPDLLKREHPLKGKKAVTSSKKCTDCGKDYQPSGNAQVRCQECKAKKTNASSSKEIKSPTEFKKIKRSCDICRHMSLCKTSRKCKPGSFEFFEERN